MKNAEPPYSDEQVREHIAKIKIRMQKNNDIILACENSLTDAGLLEDKKKVDVRIIKPSEKELFKAYERLKKSQSNLQAQLEQFEAYLLLRSAQA